MAKLGAVLAGSAVLPMLPFDRSGKAYAQHGGARSQQGRRPDGVRVLAQLRAGRLPVHLLRRLHHRSARPGSEASKVSWVGTCKNTKDGKDYLVSYNDCCGKTACARCLCNFNERERPGYRMGVFNDINWCMANTQTMYHCTVSVIVGVSDAS